MKPRRGKRFSVSARRFGGKIPQRKPFYTNFIGGGVASADSFKNKIRVILKLG